MALGAAIPGPVRAPFRPLPEVSPRQPRGSRKPPEAAPGSRKPSQANRCSAAALCKPRAVRAELYTNVGYGHAVWHAPILFNPGSLPRQPGCSEAAVVLPAAVLAELSTNKGYGHARWHAPVLVPPARRSRSRLRLRSRRAACADPRASGTLLCLRRSLACRSERAVLSNHSWCSPRAL